MGTIPGVLATAASEWPDAVALVDGRTRISFAALQDAVLRDAAALVAAGLPVGGRVALWGPNSADWAVANLAVLAAGGTVVPVNTRATGPEVAAVLERAEVALVLGAEEFLGRRYADEARAMGAEVRRLDEPWSATGAAGAAGAAELAEVRRRTAALTDHAISHVQFTSGTTGRPKGVMLRHGAMVSTTSAWVSVVGLRAGDVFPVVSPCSHIAGHKTGLLSCLVAGATAMPLATFDAELLLRLVDDEGATFLQAAPTVFHDIVEVVRTRGRGIPSLRVAVTGAAVIPPQLVRDLHDVAGIGTVLAGYGLTETTGVVTITAADDPVDAVVTTCGRPVSGVELRLVDGEVLVRGPSVMAGYLDDPEATAEVLRDGWLHTGDVGEFDADGRLRIVDRLKDMVLVGGFNVFPAEVEHVLLEHDAVAQAAVVGEPDVRLGEVVVAHVVLRAPVDEGAREGVLRDHCRSRLAGYKVPRRIVVHEDLPRNAAGKVVKGELRD